MSDHARKTDRAIFAVIGLAALAVAIVTAPVAPAHATAFALIAIAAAMFLREIKP